MHMHSFSKNHLEESLAFWCCFSLFNTQTPLQSFFKNLATQDIHGGHGYTTTINHVWAPQSIIEACTQPEDKFCKHLI